jgi:ABC-type transporter lipoprotein component MlaA
VRYIQVNAVDGTVLGAVGTAGGQYLVLPIGNATAVSTPQQSATTSTATPAASPTTVYNDGTTTVTATPMSDGTVALTATEAETCDPAACGSHALKSVQ